MITAKDKHNKAHPPTFGHFLVNHDLSHRKYGHSRDIFNAAAVAQEENIIASNIKAESSKI